MTFGTMLSISFIIGQTNGPLEQLTRFLKSLQDAQMSLGRLEEVHNKISEDDEFKIISQESDSSGFTALNYRDLVDSSTIVFNNVVFQYQGPRSPHVLRDINIIIPEGKVTAIIGESGSGKSTLLKLLLGFYKPVSGEILVGNRSLTNISPSLWRQQCGSVMQDGFIFSNTIYNNIALDGGEVDDLQMKRAIDISNIDEFVKQLPMRYKTKIGSNGVGLSGGQKQRILIARAVYKNPKYIFFDEATSSLDANNENSIMEKLGEFFKGRTVVIIAHRLSTVKNADQIIVLEKGSVVEVGNHETLTKSRGKYFELVKNQLELES
jgi:ATP-binding cassette subfamily B protein